MDQQFENSELKGPNPETLVLLGALGDLARGFATTQALVAIARQLARIACSILKHGVDFRPELVKVTCAQP